ASDVTVLGAGIAGLAIAIACAQRGRSVTVIEQAAALTDIGAGMQIAPNGGRVLAALGVTPRAIASSAVHVIDGVSGKSVIRMPLGPGFRLIHRADLISALADRAADMGVTLRLDTRVTDIADGGRALHLSEDTAMPTARLIGADGARGRARAFVAPDHRGAFTGQVAWRAIVPVDQWPAEAQIHTGSGRHLVCYPLRDGRALNIVAVEERTAWTDAGWSHTDDPAHLRAAFAGFATPIRMLLDRVETVHLWGLMDHGATPRWTRGACTLIGDAAHPTLPFWRRARTSRWRTHGHWQPCWTIRQGGRRRAVPALRAHWPRPGQTPGIIICQGRNAFSATGCCVRSTSSGRPRCWAATTGFTITM
ncbi:MAG: FAD-dependent oxidoreductase, partial [Jannaschia helgolandensis]